jgi:hypothetical protein
MTFDQKVDVALRDLAAVSSLGIPPLTWADGPHGIRTSGTTAFPSAQLLALGPREHAKVELRPTPTDLEYYDEREGRLTTADGTYTLAVGTSSRDLSEQASFMLGRRHP